MSNIEQLSVKQLIERQGLTVTQLRMTLQRLEKVGYGSPPSCSQQTTRQTTCALSWTRRTQR